MSHKRILVLDAVTVSVILSDVQEKTRGGDGSEEPLLVLVLRVVQVHVL